MRNIQCYIVPLRHQGFVLNNEQVTVPNGGLLRLISVLFVNIGGFMLRLTKLLIKAVLIFFYGKSSIDQFIRAFLSMREFFLINP